MWYSPTYGAAAEAFDTTRKAAWVAASLQRDPIPGVTLFAPEELTAEQISQVHSAAYVQAVQSGEPRMLAESNGFAWDPGLWSAVQASTAGIVGAVLHAFSTGRHAGSLSSGLHHARRDTGLGFCTFNGLALAARVAIDAGAKRVLILDLDAHCGGGTYSLVREWPEVWGVDVSVSSFDHYTPAPGRRFTLDIVNAAGRYLDTVAARLDGLDPQPFDVVLYNAGMDPHEHAGGIRGITGQMLADREDLVFSWASRRQSPVAFCLAGGYTGWRMSEAELTDLHRITLKAAAGTPLVTPERHVLLATGILTPAELSTLPPRYVAQAEDLVRDMAEKHDTTWFIRHRTNIRCILQDFMGLNLGE